MQFMELMADIITLGILGLFAVITLGLWYNFCEIFVFSHSYLAWFNKHKVIKTILIIVTGIWIWTNALVEVHYLLWGNEHAAVPQ